jgi:hypothetical protein
MVTGKGHRRVVTGHRNGKSVVLSDQHRQPYKFKTVADFEHTRLLSDTTIEEANKALVLEAFNELFNRPAP